MWIYSRISHYKTKLEYLQFLERTYEGPNTENNQNNIDYEINNSANQRKNKESNGKLLIFKSVYIRLENDYT